MTLLRSEGIGLSQWTAPLPHYTMAIAAERTSCTLKLLPSERSQLTNLERDYQKMHVMLFGNPPDFGSIVDELKKLEAEINSLYQKSWLSFD